MKRNKTKQGKRIARNSVTGILILLAASPFLTCISLTLRLFAKYWLRGGKRSFDFEHKQKRIGAGTMSDLMNEIEKIPFGRPTPGTLGELFGLVVDFIPSILNTIPQTAGLLYPYPPVFEPVVIESRDGTPICGLVALQDADSPRPALLIVHGLFSSKNSYPIATLALHAFFEWGFNVMVIDLRNFGDSARFSKAPTTWGYRESDDILAASAFLASLKKVSTVGVLGISMGAASSLIAGALSGLEGPINGGIVALHSYADSKSIIKYLTEQPAGRLKTNLIRIIFKLMILLNTVCHGPRPVSDLRSYTRDISSQYYEMREDEILRKASPLKHLPNTEVPCLVIHSQDDLIVPADHVERLANAGANNPMVGFVINRTGGHATYIYTNRKWLLDTLRTFFSSWSGNLNYDYTGRENDINIPGNLGNQDN